MATKNVISRMSLNAGSDSAMRSGKGHFAAAAQRIAKKRSGTLQHGVPKHAPIGALNIGGSGFTKKPAFGAAKATEGQTALNPKQQGPSNRFEQIDGRVGE